MKRDYRALVAIGTIYKVLGVIVGVITLLSVVGFCISALTGATALGSLGEQLGVSRVYAIVVAGVVTGMVLIYGVAATLTLYALGEALGLLVSVAKDARQTVTLLKKREEAASQEKSSDDFR